MSTRRAKTIVHITAIQRAATLVGAAALATVLALPAAAQPPPPPAPPPTAEQPPPPPPGEQPPPPPPTQPADPAAQPADPSAPPGYGPPPGQQPPPGYGPPPGQQPPPGYGPPPPGYHGYGPPAPTGPEEMDYHEGQPIPPGYEKDTKIRKGLVIAGAVTFGTLYLLTVATGAVLMDAATNSTLSTSYREEDAAVLLVPVAGPFIAMATLDATAAGGVILAIDGIGQAGGLAMFIAGLAAKETVLVRQGDLQMSVVPVVAGGSGGSLIGTF